MVSKVNSFSSIAPIQLCKITWRVLEDFLKNAEYNASRLLTGDIVDPIISQNTI